MSETLKPVGKKQKSVSKEKVRAFERILEKEEDVYHDLYSLDTALTKKDVSYNEGKPIYIDTPHRHFYHTVDSDGKKLTYSSPSSGHMHEVLIEYNEQGEPVSVKCGPPKVISRGKMVGYKNDNHVHDISYMVSEVVKKRVRSKKALESMAAMRSDEEAAKKGVAGILRDER